jgi:hypothetical protein
LKLVIRNFIFNPIQDGRYVGVDGEDGRVVVEAEGGLALRGVRKEDGGRYQCIAENLAGARETPPVRLGVHGEIICY